MLNRVQTVDFRWDWQYQSDFRTLHVTVVNCVINASQYSKHIYRTVPWYASTWNDGFVQTPSTDLFATTTVPADNTVSLQARTCSRVAV